MDENNFGVREKIMCTIISFYRGIKDKTSKLGHPGLSIFFLESSYYMADSSRVGTMYMKFST